MTCRGVYLYSLNFNAFSFFYRKGGSSASTTRAKPAGGGSAGMWRFYTEDSPGIKV